MNNDRNSFIFIFSIFIRVYKMNKFEKTIDDKELIPKTSEALGLRPITHKEFNEFIKGKGFKGRDNYKLRELKVMFGLRPIIIGKPISVSLEGEEPTTYDTISIASTSTGIPYSTLLYAKKKPKTNGFAVVNSNGKKYCIKYGAI